MSDIDDGRGMSIELYDEHPNERRRFTFHLDFMAFAEEEALVFAQVYAEGLNAFRLETDMCTARVSVDGNWSKTQPVYCGAPGPHEYDSCTDVAGHEFNHGGGITRSWTDEDVPRVPDTVGRPQRVYRSARRQCDGYAR